MKDLNFMKYNKIKEGAVLYWNGEPVRVDSKSIEKGYGKTVHITRFAAKNPKHNGYATVSPGVLSITPANVLFSILILLFAASCTQYQTVIKECDGSEVIYKERLKASDRDQEQQLKSAIAANDDCEKLIVLQGRDTMYQYARHCYDVRRNMHVTIASDREGEIVFEGSVDFLETCPGSGVYVFFIED
jgi:hypothetical protein